MIDKETENRILDFIANSKEPVHSTEIANSLGINRITATKYLSVLHGRGLIYYRNVGMAKVWVHVENPMLLAFEKNDENDLAIKTLNALADGVCVLDKAMRIVWANRKMEERHGRIEKIRGRKCHEVFHEEKEMCKKCPTKETFETGKNCLETIRKKGYDIEISTSPLRGPKGKIDAVIEIVRAVKRK